MNLPLVFLGVLTLFVFFSVHVAQIRSNIQLTINCKVGGLIFLCPHASSVCETLLVKWENDTKTGF